MKDILHNAIEIFQEIDNPEIFDMEKKNLKQRLFSLNTDQKIIRMIEAQSYYVKNDFSNEATNRNMLCAKEKLIDYLKEILKDSQKIKISKEDGLIILKNVLSNFYLFMETYFEKSLNKRSGIKREQLDSISIQNEYDVQHILFSLIKPIFPDARTEVVQDTGFKSVRIDILIEELSAAIEVKCSRDSMKVRDITEEIASDIIHYQEENIFFFIYDKNKIIDNPQTFIRTYEKKQKNKNIFVIIHQPKIL